MRKKSKQAKKIAPAQTGRVLYLYAISQKAAVRPPQIEEEGIDGHAIVEGLPCEGYVCWLSRVDQKEFAEDLIVNMQDLEWLATAGLRHQRVVSSIVEKFTALPARFGTVFLSEATMAEHVRARKGSLHSGFELVADADEWGIKVFEVKKPTKSLPGSRKPASGVEYLRRKAGEMQPRRSRAIDEDVLKLSQQLNAISAASSSGGKASVGQPGLLWHGSFLVRRENRKKLESVLKRFSRKWRDQRRIDWSGPWPPYSFVGEHAE